MNNNFEANKWRNQHYENAGYSHFDNRIKLDNNLLPDKIWDYLNDEDQISKHGFYPLIYAERVSTKFSKKNGIKSKTRPICYSSHMDRCVLKYYGYMLNRKYNDYVKQHNIHFNSVAYRDNLHKNNIHFAKQAFDFIKKGECDIFIGDFTSFFDNLNHKYLKKMLCEVLNVSSLPKDWYNIFKNITKYSTFDILDILKINNLIKDDDLENITNPSTQNKLVRKKTQPLNQQRLALTKEQFKANKNLIKPNKLPYGVPQGSSISAVLSNVYMIEFDKSLQKFVSSFNGLYMRYSDDFIIIVPKNENVSFSQTLQFLEELIKSTPGILIQNDKRRTYHYEDAVVVSLDHPDQPVASIDYLGFVFDGVNVTIRPQSISKYYTRMYRKLNTIIENDGLTREGKRVSYKNLYRVYSQKGRNGYKNENRKRGLNNYDKFKDGNFFTYVYKADKIFNSDYNPNDPNSKKQLITKSTDRHMLKIRRKRDLIEKKG